MINIYATFAEWRDAEEAFAALVVLGLTTTDLSLLVPRLMKGNLDALEPNQEQFPGVPDAGFLDPAGEAGFVGGGRGFPQLEAEGSLFLESEVGGGISTSEPSDDVSAPEEMDDPQSVAEEGLYPQSDESYGGQDVHDIERLVDTGFVGATELNTVELAGSSQAETTALQGLYQSLSILPLPPYGSLLGDGLFATELTTLILKNREYLDLEAKITQALRNLGNSPERVSHIISNLKQGGGVLVVSWVAGKVDSAQIETVIQEHHGMFF